MIGNSLFFMVAKYCINTLYLYDKWYRNIIVYMFFIARGTNDYSITSNILKSKKHFIKRDRVEFIHFDELIVKNYF